MMKLFIRQSDGKFPIYEHEVVARQKSDLLALQESPSFKREEFFPVTEEIPDFDNATHRLGAYQRPEKVDISEKGKPARFAYVVRREVISREKEEIEERERLVWEDVRNIRNAALSETDHMMLPDYPITEKDKADLVKKRQALRDLPDSKKNGGLKSARTILESLQS